jgi:hypothetical protein
MIASRKIALAVWLVAGALWAARLSNDRVEIMFNPATDGPIRYAERPEAPAMGGTSGGICATTMTYTPGASSTAVLVPCAATTGTLTFSSTSNRTTQGGRP